MELEKTFNLLKTQFSPRHFFEELLEALLKREVLNNSEFEVVQHQLLELLAKQVKRFNKDSSSSIKVEVAEALMDSIYYTLSIYFKSLEDLGCSADLIKDKGIEALFNEGKMLINEKVETAKKLLEGVQKTKLITVNYAYNDTIDYGLPLFFKAYDQYSYDKDYEHLLFNIFDCVLMNSLGNILLNNKVGNLLLKKEKVKLLQDQLEPYNSEELERTLKMAAMQLCEAFHIEETPLLSYIYRAISKTSIDLKQKLELQQVQHIFLPHCPKQAQTYYIDGEKMANENFKELTDEIRQCSKAKDKVKLIKEHIHSMYDLIDVLEAECLFEEEYLKVFEVLTIMEINLLVNSKSELWDKEEELGQVQVGSLEDTIQTLMEHQTIKDDQAEDKKEWQHWLVIYLRQHSQK